MADSGAGGRVAGVGFFLRAGNAVCGARLSRRAVGEFYSWDHDVEWDAVLARDAWSSYRGHAYSLPRDCGIRVDAAGDPCVAGDTFRAQHSAGARESLSCYFAVLAGIRSHQTVPA